MADLPELFTSVVAFYRCFADKKRIFEKLPDLNFSIDLDQRAADALCNLNQLSHSRSSQLLVEQIKIGEKNLLIEQSDNFHEYIGSNICFQFEDIDLGGVFESSLDGFLKYKRLSEEPDCYFIAEIDFLNDGDSVCEEIDNYRRILKLITSFRQICDHHQESEDDGSIVFHVLGVKKLDMQATFGEEELSHDLSDIDSLLPEFLPSQQRTHDIEKKKIFKKCLVDTLFNRPKPFCYLLRNFSAISKQYRNNHDLYIHEFSFDKFIDDVAKEKLEFITHINATVSAIGLRFASIPLIALVGKFFSQTLSDDKLTIQVSTSIYCVLLGVFLFFNHHTLSEISRSIQNTFSLDKVNQEGFSQSDITNVINSSIRSLETRINVAWGLVILFYLGIVFLLAYVWCFL